MRLSTGNWDEEQTIVVSSDNPVEVKFHRPWEGKRQVTGRLIVDGEPFETFPGPGGRRLGAARTLPPYEVQAAGQR